MRIVLLAALAAALLLYPSGAMAGGGKLRVLVVTGGHDFERGPFFALFDSFRDISWREVQHPHANEMFAPDRRGEYDVVVFYDMPQAISEEEKRWLTETVREGKGVVALHHTLGAYTAWPEYARLIGGKYLQGPETIDGVEWKASTYRDDVPHTVAIADRRHPITRGLADFQIVDELYGGFWVSPRAHALLTVDHPLSGRVVGWTWKYGKARVVYLQPGHGPTAYRDANYRTLVERSILWVARKLR